jgi:hypothetical protein
MLRKRRHKVKKSKTKTLVLDNFETDSLLERPRSEKLSNKNQEWEQKQAKKSKKKTFEERLADYEARQRAAEKKE